jgi:mannose-6-phosphate isomerase-like protein (cupin superfamily)
MSALERDPPRPVRRVVTGRGGNGLTVIASDAAVSPILPPLLPGTAFFDLWGADTVPGLPNDGAKPDYRDWFPPDGGYRFGLITLPPDGTRQPPEDRAEALAETNALLPGLMDVMDPQHPGWHATDTIDLIYVLRGGCVLKLDSGETVPLEAGDTLIQNGARHAWGNPGQVDCALLVVSLGVKRKS